MKLSLLFIGAASLSGAVLVVRAESDAVKSGSGTPVLDAASLKKAAATRILDATSRGSLSAEALKSLDHDLAVYEFLRETDGDAEAGGHAHRGRKKAASQEKPEVDAIAALLADPAGREFFTRLISNDDGALQDYLDATFFTAAAANRADGLLAWAKIDKAYPESRDGVWRRTAAALASVFATKRMITETTWGKTLSRELDPVARFEFFRASAERGKLVPYYFTAPAWELAFVVHGGYQTNEELLWAQEMAPVESFSQRAISKLAYAPVHYRSFNYRDESVQHFPMYYDGKPGGLSRMADYGAVCGGISHTGSTVANAHGVPAFTIGQPGHCAYVYKGSPSVWDGGNFVSGWHDSNGAHQLGFWASAKSVDIRVLTHVYTHPGFREALRLTRLAAVKSDAGDDKGALATLDKAVALCPMMYPAHAARLAALSRTGATPETLARACVLITRDFSEFPAAADSLRAPVENELAAKLPAESRAAYLAAIAQAITTSPAFRQQGLDNDSFMDTFTRQLAVYGLKERETDAVIRYAVNPPKAKKGEIPAASPTLHAPKKTGELVGYLNALAPAANARGSFAKSVEAIVAALPLELRSSITLKVAPAAEDEKPRYNAKNFVKIGEWSAASVASAPIITQGWKELEFTIPASLRKPGRIVVAAVQKGGEPATLENLRLFADGDEVDADTSSLAVNARRPGLFVIELDAAHAHAGKLTLKTLVADDSKIDASFAGDISLLEAPGVKR